MLIEYMEETTYVCINKIHCAVFWNYRGMKYSSHICIYRHIFGTNASTISNCNLIWLGHFNRVFLAYTINPSVGFTFNA